MKVEFGPPGHKGVTQIMGLSLGDTPTSSTPRPHKIVAGAAVATWLLGAFVGSKTTKNVAIGGLGAILLATALRNGTVETPEVLTDIQGWG